MNAHVDAPGRGVKYALAFTAFLRGVLGIALQWGQLVFCKVAFDGIDAKHLSGNQRAMAHKLFGDVGAVPDIAREVIVQVKGARVGGSWLAALRLLHLALTVPLDALAPGEVAVGVIVAPDLRLARQALRFVVGAAKGCPSIKRLVESESGDSITLRRPDGARVAIECLPATRGGSALRGRSLFGAVLDECAFFHGADYQVNDAELFKAVAPRILPGGQVLLVSTPWCESGLLHELFRDNFGKPQTALAALCPTPLMRKDERIRRMIERERVRDPQNARREFDAEFVTQGAGRFFDAAAIGRCISAGAFCGTGPVGCGADFAFRSDSSALIVVRRVAERVEVIDWCEMKPTKSQALRPSAVVERFAAMAKHHGCGAITADYHYIEAVREHATAAGIRLVAAPGGQGGKLKTFVRARALLHDGRCVFRPEHGRLVAQLREVTSSPTPGGGLAIKSPRRRGSHGDLVSAWVLAVHAAFSAVTTRPYRELMRYRHGLPKARGIPVVATGSAFGRYQAPDELRLFVDER